MSVNGSWRLGRRLCLLDNLDLGCTFYRTHTSRRIVLERLLKVVQVDLIDLFVAAACCTVGIILQVLDDLGIRLPLEYSLFALLATRENMLVNLAAQSSARAFRLLESGVSAGS